MPTVRGNHDRWIAAIPYEQLSSAGQFAFRALEARQREELDSLPNRLEFSAEMVLVHGTPDDDNAYLLEEVVDGRFASAKRAVVTERLGSYLSADVSGHSHNASLRFVPDGPLILNPGSVGCPAFADRPQARTLEYRSPHARYAILTKRKDQWGAEMYALEYDWSARRGARLTMGRPDWAETMATGILS